MAKTLLVLQITATKNSTISMVGTKEGMFSVRNEVLKKRNFKIPTKDEPIVTFDEPTLVIIDEHKKGDYIFSGDGSATQDSSRTKLQAGLAKEGDEDAYEPAYKIGDKPTWSEAGFTVKTFTTLKNLEDEARLARVQRELATA